MTGRAEQTVADVATQGDSTALDENVSATSVTADPRGADDTESESSGDATVPSRPDTESSATPHETHPDETPPTRTGTDRGAVARRRPAAVAVAVVVTAALVIATVWSVVRYRDDAALSAADREVGPAAADAAAAVLSYKPDTVTADLARAQSHLTGDFATYFDKLGSEVVVPAANGRHMSSTATVTATSVVSADSGHAVALVFVNQVTTADDLKQPTTMSSSLRLELVKIGEHWLVDKLDTV